MALAQYGNQQYIKLEDRLVLLAWLNDRFGYRSNRERLADVKNAANALQLASTPPTPSPMPPSTVPSDPAGPPRCGWSCPGPAWRSGAPARPVALDPA